VSGFDALVARGTVVPDVPLAPLTTYKLGGPARWFADVADDGDVEALCAVLSDEPVPVLVLGRGSNLVVSDRGFDGLVVRLGGVFAAIEHGPEDIRAGGAVRLPVLARAAVGEGRLGLEFYVGIPGTVGGAVRQNAGCHGSETVDVLRSADLVDLSSGGRREATAAELDLSYRHSNLTDTDLVLSARFRFERGSRAEGERHMREITRWRREHQPGGTLNAGSVFKNPPGDAAGRLIDAAGLKGFRVGDVSVSGRHANFFVAGPEATAGDVWRLVREVRARVRRGTGIDLEPEIRFAGDFDPA
jgi:UDP-N-acetylmuramate dehydrogenase